MATTITIARIYDAKGHEARGFRVFVDRLWPRGISKAEAALDMWAKDIAPTTELREWFGHRPERFAEFSARYRHELDRNPALPDFIDSLKGRAAVTLLYAAKDPQINHAVVLHAYLTRKLSV